MLASEKRWLWVFLHGVCKHLISVVNQQTRFSCYLYYSCHDFIFEWTLYNSFSIHWQTWSLNKKMKSFFQLPFSVHLLHVSPIFVPLLACSGSYRAGTGRRGREIKTIKCHSSLCSFCLVKTIKLQLVSIHGGDEEQRTWLCFNQDVSFMCIYLL